MEQDGVKTRSDFLEPERIVAGFGLKKGDHVADFGAGHGYFTIPIARAVGGDGRVYAVDIQQSALDIVRARAQMEHLLNVEYVRADIDAPQGSRLKEKFLDFALIANVLFQSENRLAAAQEAYRILRSGGRLAVIEWEAAGKSPSDSYAIGPHADLRVKKDDARSLCLQAGFEFDREFAAGSHHYGMLFVKR
ncbi:MAG: methyltransferase domain-containing protein [Patescibacteria group bacterium]